MNACVDEAVEREFPELGSIGYVLVVDAFIFPTLSDRDVEVFSSE